MLPAERRLFAVRSGRDEARAGEAAQRTKEVRERLSRRATKYRVDLTSKEGRRAGPPALAEIGYGCFLPDLTRFTTMQCGAARRCSLPRGRSVELIIGEGCSTGKRREGATVRVERAISSRFGAAAESM